MRLQHNKNYVFVDFLSIIAFLPCIVNHKLAFLSLKKYSNSFIGLACQILNSPMDWYFLSYS